jgi:protein tyrosine phosphatase (PTP) superfamily phosphohydrolase (DUF442 family)
VPPVPGAVSVAPGTPPPSSRGFASNYPSTPPPPLARKDPEVPPADQPIVRLSIPETPPASPANAVDPVPTRTSKATAPEDASGTPSLPVGIPQFAEVKSGRLATGLKPHATDGLAWLQAKGYRTIVHLRQPAEEDTAERRLVEKHGMKYVSLEVSALSLTWEVAERFNRLVGETADQPVFVYDEDGRLAGALWYLYFRLVDNTGEDRARTEAARLGLRDDSSTAAQALWATLQSIVSARGK